MSLAGPGLPLASSPPSLALQPAPPPALRARDAAISPELRRSIPAIPSSATRTTSGERPASPLCLARSPSAAPVIPGSTTSSSRRIVSSPACSIGGTPSRTFVSFGGSTLPNSRAQISRIALRLSLRRRLRTTLPRCRKLRINLPAKHLMQRLRRKLPPRLLGQACQLLARAAALVFVLRLHVDREPLAKRLVNLPAVNRPDVVAMRPRRILPGERAVAMGKRQLVSRTIEAPDLLVPLPHRVALAVPTEFVGVDQVPRSHAAHDHPRQKAVRRRPDQVTRRFPASAAGIVERPSRRPREADTASPAAGRRN